MTWVKERRFPETTLQPLLADVPTGAENAAGAYAIWQKHGCWAHHSVRKMLEHLAETGVIARRVVEVRSGSVAHLYYRRAETK